MININPEGHNNDVLEEEKLSIEEQEKNILLHEYLVLRESAEIALLGLDGLNQDLNVTLQKNRIEEEIEKLNKNIEELGGEREVK